MRKLVLTEKMKKMMTSFEFKCYMRLLGITLRDKKTNEYVWNEICKQFNGSITTYHFPTHIKERMLKFFRHQTRRHKMTRVLIQGHSDGNRCLGKPTRTFFFQWVMLRKGYGGLYKAPTQEERRKRAAKRIER